MAFFDAVKTRRTYYSLKDTSSISDDRIQELVNETILHCPSPFNSQSTRVLVLLKEEHGKLWDITKEVVQPLVPKEGWPTTEAKIKRFRAAYGTILFFESESRVQGLQKQFAIFADKFPQWSEHTSAMHQFILWTALVNEGLGCNLQHYNPLIDERVKNDWEIPADWILKAQLVFGDRGGPPVEKTFEPLEKRVITHGK